MKARKPQVADALLEIGTEEVPARFLPPARRQLRELAGKALEASRLSFSSIEAHATPRRFVLVVRGVPAEGESMKVEVAGPMKAAAFGPDGKPTPALEGFARKQGVAIRRLEERPTDKGPRMYCVRVEPGRKAAAELPVIFSGLVTSGLKFPKSMRWPQADFIFPRPIRWLLALYGKSPLKVGCGPLKSGTTTRGRRFFQPAPLAVRDVPGYFKAMKKAGILVDQRERQAVIRRQAEKLASQVKGHVVWDESLLGEVSDLVEAPLPVRGTFPRAALEIPREVLVASMQEHQRYFPVEGADGALLPHFITVSNGVSTPQVVAGNERVLKARLADARFFFAEDRKKPLEGFLAGLKGAVWQNNAGTMFDKAQRLSTLSSWLAGQVGEDGATAERAAYLGKADLVTQMVGEFPTLQGVAGGFYASASGEQGPVARAIAEHYRPIGASDDIPETGPGCVVALADRLDNLVGHFALGHAPTGTADPYALRRAAIGVLRILTGRKWRLSLTVALGNTSVRFGHQFPDGPEWAKAVPAVRAFLRDRMAVMLEEDGYQHDEIEAALVDFNDALAGSLRLRALALMKGRPDWRETILALSRVTNIVKGWKGMPLKDPAGLEGPEKDLWDAHEAVRETCAGMAREGRFDELFAVLATLKPAIDTFFEKVLVNDKDEAVKERRLGLVRRVDVTLRLFADIRALVIS